MKIANAASHNVTTEDCGRKCAYDAPNRFVPVNTGIAVIKTIATYTYDGMGRITTQTDGDGNTTDFYYDGSQDIEERAGGNVTTQTIFSPVYVNAPLARNNFVSGSFSSRIFFTCDANYNITSVISSGGTVLQHESYTSYGVASDYTSSWSGTTDGYNLRYGFQGMFYDVATGLYYAAADENNDGRWYSPTLEQWTRVDSYGYIDGMNPYVFVADNPINRVDPSGNAAELVSATVGFPGVKSGIGDDVVKVTGGDWEYYPFFEFSGLPSGATIVQHNIRSTVIYDPKGVKTAELTEYSLDIGVIPVLAGNGRFGDKIGVPGGTIAKSDFSAFSALGNGTKAVVSLHTDAGVYASAQVQPARGIGSPQIYIPGIYGAGQVLDVYNSYDWSSGTRALAAPEDRLLGPDGRVLLRDGNGVGAPLVSWQHDDTITFTFKCGSWDWSDASIRYSSTDPKTNAVLRNPILNRTAPDLTDR